MAMSAIIDILSQTQMKFFLIMQRTALPETNSRIIETIWVVWALFNGKTGLFISEELKRLGQELKLKR